MNGTLTVRRAGFALITGLIFLIVLTVAGVVVIQSTSMSYRMAANSAYQRRAREVSESGRLAVASVLPMHTYERSWHPVTLLPHVVILDKDSSGQADDLYGVNSEVSLIFDPLNPLALTKDATYWIDLDGDDNFSNPPDLRADISVYRTDTRLDQGSGAAMLAGYAGLGKGAGAGGGVIFFYVASQGEGPSQAQSVTSSDVRTRVFN